MAKNKKKGVDILIISSMVLLFIVLMALAVGAGFFENSFFDSITPDAKSKIECDVDISRGTLGVTAARITSAQCVAVDTCFLGFVAAPLFLGGALELLTDEGELRMFAGQKLVDKEKYSLLPFQSKTFKLTTCTSEKNIRLQIVNDKGQVLQTESKEVI